MYEYIYIIYIQKIHAKHISIYCKPYGYCHLPNKLHLSAWCHLSASPVMPLGQVRGTPGTPNGVPFGYHLVI